MVSVAGDRHQAGSPTNQRKCVRPGRLPRISADTDQVTPNPNDQKPGRREGVKLRMAAGVGLGALGLSIAASLVPASHPRIRMFRTADLSTRCAITPATSCTRAGPSRTPFAPPDPLSQRASQQPPFCPASGLIPQPERGGRSFRAARGMQGASRQHGLSQGILPPAGDRRGGRIRAGRWYPRPIAATLIIRGL